MNQQTCRPKVPKITHTITSQEYAVFQFNPREKYGMINGSWFIVLL